MADVNAVNPNFLTPYSKWVRITEVTDAHGKVGSGTLVVTV